MAFDYRRYEMKRDTVLVDPRNHFAKWKDKINTPRTASTMFAVSAFGVAAHPWVAYVGDLLLFYNTLYFLWFIFLSRTNKLPFRMPKTAKKLDPNYKAPGSGKLRQADGILYLGNEERSNEEVWFTNTDARTHILYLGTTGSGKTEGLKSLASNALGWGSGFIYVDGKADTDLWGSISALARRFGRDDDLLVLNYMTGNSTKQAASNTINPFAQGSPSNITNMLVSLMPEVSGENSMWKDRAVALIAALLPVLVWQRNFQEKPLNISVIRDALNFKRIIELSRRPEIPSRDRQGLRGYLDTLPGYTDAGFNDDGTEKPNPNGPPMDYSTIYQQHGYLAMQFTRQLQSLADDYGYIFETQSADIDMMDVVLNRRLLVVLIPALEKSADETANLGKIVGSMLKNMMGGTLGSTVEGDTDIALENKPTRSSTPFMAIFDEVGYYTTQGMAVMAAQARSLGFCLVFAGQDLPALEKRVKEEARSITANCNIKIFGKLEDPTQTKEFFEKTVGEATVVESSNRKEVKVMFGQKRLDKTDSVNVTSRAKASYGQLKNFREGQAIISFGDSVVQTKMFLSEPGKIKSLRVNKFVSMPHADPDGKLSSKDVDAILERLGDARWSAKSGKFTADDDIGKLADFFNKSSKAKRGPIECGCFALTQLAVQTGLFKPGEEAKATPAPAPQAATKSAAAVMDASLVAKRDDTPPPAPKQPETKPAEPTPDMQQGTAETISWKTLLDEGGDQQAKPSEALSGAPTEKIPDTSDTISWKDLVDNDKVAKPDIVPPQPAQTGFGMPTGGFGVSSFGTGFGGIGAMGFPASKPADKGDNPESKKDDKKDGLSPPDSDGTINWKDLLD